MDVYRSQSGAHKAIEEATRRYLKANQMPTAVDVTVEKLDNGFGRLRVALKSGEADPALAFIRQQGPDWKVLAFGTYFDAAFYEKEGIPATLRV